MFSMLKIKSVLLLLIIIINVQLIQCKNICEICSCSEYENVGLNVKCNNQTGKILNQINLEEISWPELNINTYIYMNDMNLLVIKTLPGNQNIVSLNFDNNQIRTIMDDPFKNLKNLESISLVNNSIIDLPSDLIESLEYVRVLNLSTNSLTHETFKINVKNLKTIDLSYNRFIQLDQDVLNKMDYVVTLNLEGNKLFLLDIPEHKNMSLKNINLSRNRISYIAVTMFQAFKNLETINLSYNLITNIHQHAFKDLLMLKYLDLSYNNLVELQFPLELSLSIETVSFGNNKLQIWPIKSVTENLKNLYLQNNNLREIKIDLKNQLQVLNLSSNDLEIFPYDVDFEQMKFLDLSSNYFKNIPDIGSITTTNLDTLILDNNPIENILFENWITCKKLSLNNLHIKSLDFDSFANVVGTDNTDQCVELEISHCKQLSKIDENAFQTIKLCKLDLSYNNLTVLPQNLTDWKSIKNGINLQGNPFKCDCSAQWMLDIILNQLYSVRDHQYLLTELRCNSPSPFTGKRFVKYYKRIGAFCGASEAMKMESNQNLDDDEVQVAHIKIIDSDIFVGLPIFIIIIIGSIVLLTAIIALGVYFTRQQHRNYQRNRRYNYK